MSATARPLDLVDGRYGPILDVNRQRLGGSEPSWWLCTTSLARFPIGSPFNESPPTSAGTSIDLQHALRRAVGEALERYSALNASIPSERATLEESAFVGGFPLCAPDEPCPPSFRSPPQNVSLTQSPALRLSTGERVLIPMALVSLDFRPDPSEPPVALPISTGIAFHPKLHEAIWRGLCEVVERDAVMTMWWLREFASELSFAGDVPASIIERLERLEACGFEARVYDITTEIGIPTVFCVLCGDRFPRLVVGAATRADPADACCKALDEVVSMRIALQGPMARHSSAREEAPLGLVEHARLYADERDHPAFDFLLRCERSVLSYHVFARRGRRVPQDFDELAEIAEEFARDDLSVLWANVTSADVAPFGFVVRVVVPELVPLSPDDRIRWLATPRLLRRAGLETATRAAFNPHPHPFA